MGFRKKKWAFFGVNLPKMGSFGVILSNLSENVPFQLNIDKIFEVRAKRGKNLKFYVEILKKKKGFIGYWNVVIGFKICEKILISGEKQGA